MRACRLVFVTLLVVIAPRPGAAHVVPVPPSTCAFDPVTIEVPDAGISTTADPPQPADAFQMIYDPQASQAQFDLHGVPPRGFAVAGVPGTLALPAIFAATLRTSGDLDASPTLVFAMNGSTTAVPMALTTGLAAAGSTVVEGAPMAPAPDGTFTLVGLSAPDPLSAPLAGGLLVVRLTCRPVPRPDTDQFTLATRTTAVSAALARTFTARVIFAPGPTDVPDFGRPAIVRATMGDAVVATAHLPGGLPPRGRKLFVGRSDDGRAAVGVRSLRRSGQVVFLLALKFVDPAVSFPVTGPVTVAVSYEVGGLLSRVTLPMQPRRRGTMLRYQGGGAGH